MADVLRERWEKTRPLLAAATPEQRAVFFGARGRGVPFEEAKALAFPEAGKGSVLRAYDKNRETMRTDEAWSLAIKGRTASAAEGWTERLQEELAAEGFAELQAELVKGGAAPEEAKQRSGEGGWHLDGPEAEEDWRGEQPEAWANWRRVNEQSWERAAALAGRIGDPSQQWEEDRSPPLDVWRARVARGEDPMKVAANINTGLGMRQQRAMAGSRIGRVVEAVRAQFMGEAGKPITKPPLPLFVPPGATLADVRRMEKAYFWGGVVQQGVPMAMLGGGAGLAARGLGAAGKAGVAAIAAGSAGAAVEGAESAVEGTEAGLSPGKTAAYAGGQALQTGIIDAAAGAVVGPVAKGAVRFGLRPSLEIAGAGVAGAAAGAPSEVLQSRTAEGLREAALGDEGFVEGFKRPQPGAAAAGGLLGAVFGAGAGAGSRVRAGDPNAIGRAMQRSEEPGPNADLEADMEGLEMDEWPDEWFDDDSAWEEGGAVAEAKTGAREIDLTPIGGKPGKVAVGRKAASDQGTAYTLRRVFGKRGTGKRNPLTIIHTLAWGVEEDANPNARLLREASRALRTEHDLALVEFIMTARDNALLLDPEAVARFEAVVNEAPEAQQRAFRGVQKQMHLWAANRKVGKVRRSLEQLRDDWNLGTFLRKIASRDWDPIETGERLGNQEGYEIRHLLAYEKAAPAVAEWSLRRGGWWQRQEDGSMAFEEGGTPRQLYQAAKAIMEERGWTAQEAEGQVNALLNGQEHGLSAAEAGAVSQVLQDMQAQAERFAGALGLPPPKDFSRPAYSIAWTARNGTPLPNTADAMQNIALEFQAFIAEAFTRARKQKALEAGVEAGIVEPPSVLARPEGPFIYRRQLEWIQENALAWYNAMRKNGLRMDKDGRVRAEVPPREQMTDAEALKHLQDDIAGENRYGAAGVADPPDMATWHLPRSALPVYVEDADIKRLLQFSHHQRFWDDAALQYVNTARGYGQQVISNTVFFIGRNLQRDAAGTVVHTTAAEALPLATTLNGAQLLAAHGSGRRAETLKELRADRRIETLRMILEQSALIGVKTEGTGETRPTDLVRLNVPESAAANTLGNKIKRWLPDKVVEPYRTAKQGVGELPTRVGIGAALDKELLRYGAERGIRDPGRFAFDESAWQSLYAATDFSGKPEWAPLRVAGKGIPYLKSGANAMGTEYKTLNRLWRSLRAVAGGEKNFADRALQESMTPEKAKKQMARVGARASMKAAKYGVMIYATYSSIMGMIAEDDEAWKALMSIPAEKRFAVLATHLVERENLEWDFDGNQWLSPYGIQRVALAGVYGLFATAKGQGEARQAMKDFLHTVGKTYLPFYEQVDPANVNKLSDVPKNLARNMIPFGDSAFGSLTGYDLQGRPAVPRGAQKVKPEMQVQGAGPTALKFPVMGGSPARTQFHIKASLGYVGAQLDAMTSAIFGDSRPAGAGANAWPLTAEDRVMISMGLKSNPVPRLSPYNRQVMSRYRHLETLSNTYTRSTQVRRGDRPPLEAWRARDPDPLASANGWLAMQPRDKGGGGVRKAYAKVAEVELEITRADNDPEMSGAQKRNRIRQLHEDREAALKNLDITMNTAYFNNQKKR